MLADQVDYVVGVDTHRDQHMLAVVAAPTGSCCRAAAGTGECSRLLRDAAVRRAARACPGLGG